MIYTIGVLLCTILTCWILPVQAQAPPPDVIAIQPQIQPAIDTVIPSEIYLDLVHNQGWITYVYGSLTQSGFKASWEDKLPIVSGATPVAQGQPAPFEIVFDDFMAQSKCDPAVVKAVGIRVFKLTVK